MRAVGCAQAFIYPYVKRFEPAANFGRPPSTPPRRKSDPALRGSLTKKSEGFVLAREFLLEPGDVIEKAFTCEAKKVESKLRILKIQLLHLLVTCAQHFPIFHALNGLGA